MDDLELTGKETKGGDEENEAQALIRVPGAEEADEWGWEWDGSPEGLKLRPTKPNDIGWSQFISEMYGSMADAPLEAFEDLQTSADRLELQRAVDDAERDITEGNEVESSEVLEKLKRWSAGES